MSCGHIANQANDGETRVGLGGRRRAFTKDEKRRVDDRADFMKRFFSVAVSVGFAAKISDFSFLSTLAIPTDEQIRQVVLLIFAMIVVVGSWEFYFSSINCRPLIDRTRFYIDIAIVSL